jgi:hypothetical protein
VILFYVLSNVKWKTHAHSLYESTINIFLVSLSNDMLLESGADLRRFGLSARNSAKEVRLVA